MGREYSFSELFEAATGHAPFPYQVRFANGAELPEVLAVPTGVGKTATVVLGFLHRRRSFPERTPRRLVYCLPMRTLVEQTEVECRKWLEILAEFDPSFADVNVHVLMGGADKTDWHEHPEREAILIGTQDMLLSRALNRGYGMSRYQWPLHFALLNNDCLWVLDETQLMGVGVTTSAQLQGFRDKLTVYGESQTVWMSATLNAAALTTVDYPRPANGWNTVDLNDEDRGDSRIQQKVNARKPCRRAAHILTKDNENTLGPLADEVLQAHQPGHLTLVVVNRVERAQRLFTAINELGQQANEVPEACLIHSRFRPHERGPRQEHALDDENIPLGGRIIVSTQAIEAGVDLSATTLFSELAPWSSLVQRFGRCNRRGVCGIDGRPPADVVWIDIDTSGKSAKELALPYSPDELDRSRESIEPNADVGPQSLEKVENHDPPPVVHTIRRKDLIDLFDTTPDLAGNDLDVSRYIRDSDDTDVQVYWRAWDTKENKGAPPNEGFARPARGELCSVSIAQIKKFLKKRSGWRWDPLDRSWRSCGANDVRPGLVLAMQTEDGGYDEDLGWTRDAKHKPQQIAPQAEEPLEAMEDDDSGEKNALTLLDHTQDVVDAMEELRQSPAADFLDDDLQDVLTRAAWWHDVGKLHPAFQGAMHNARDDLDINQYWAKSGTTGWLKFHVPDERHPRKGFRHELASALAWLHHCDDEPRADLIAYLIASHHGKVRLSIRSMPNEIPPADLSKRFARGVWDGDRMPAFTLGNGDACAAFEIDLSLMELGETNGNPTWLARTLQLREEFGPFRLAWLESLLMLADWRGSAAGDAR